ncbi:MAG: universal stress protein [Deltaproteobacteria bacterium]|jgi:nucleotide-binding universal stress UspA family protein
MKKKILIAIDDSENAKRAVEFVAATFKADHTITLFSVSLNTTAICDLNSPGLTPYFVSEQTTFCQMEDQQKALMQTALEKGKETLRNAGFEEKNIQARLETEKKGVARAILEEIHSGYDLVVLGRRGIGRVQEFFMGSISQKVVNSARDVSILLVD